jgi:YgiT-type zinc finger domain-containing protein
VVGAGGGTNERIHQIETQERLVTYTEEVNHGVVVIRGAPARVCTECGNVWYSGAVIAKLEQIVDTVTCAFRTEVAVVNYGEAA